jgi:hypothetical protein
MSSARPCYAPNLPPPLATPRSGERLFEFLRASDQVPMSCELRFHGESYGWEVQFFERGDFLYGHGAFVLRGLAVQSAEDERSAMERMTNSGDSCFDSDQFVQNPGPWAKGQNSLAVVLLVVWEGKLLRLFSFLLAFLRLSPATVHEHANQAADSSQDRNETLDIHPGCNQPDTAKDCDEAEREAEHLPEPFGLMARLNVRRLELMPMRQLAFCHGDNPFSTARKRLVILHQHRWRRERASKRDGLRD